MASPRNAPAQGGYIVLQQLRGDEWRVVGDVDRRPGLPARKSRGRVLTFLRHCVDELRRVQWPNRQQVGSATAVVLDFVVIAGAYLGLLDAIWKPRPNLSLPAPSGNGFVRCLSASG